jgi:hypothetical protein
MKALERKWKGMLVLIPVPEVPGSKVEDHAMELIKRTIGYHLKLKI